MATWQEFADQYGGGLLGSLSGVHNSKLYDTMARQIAGAIGYTGQTSIPGTYEFTNANEGGTFTDTAQGKQASPDFLKALEAYQFAKTSPTEGAITQGGQNVGTFTAGNKDTGFDKFANVAVPAALAAIGGQLAGGFFSGLGADAALGNGAFLGEGVASGIPAWDASVGLGSIRNGAPAVFNAAADSQLASSQLGITGAQSAAAATAPASVNLGSLGGSGLLGNLGNTASTAAGWMKDNPTLGRLLLGGATSLLSGAGGGSSGGSVAPVGPAVKWNSPMQQGLLNPVQQYAPPALTQPAGLLASGQKNDGAWRYLKG